MKNNKVCATVDDLTCQNCLYSFQCDEDYYCRYSVPDAELPEPVTFPEFWCGMGLWLCGDKDTGEVSWEELPYAVEDVS